MEGASLIKSGEKKGGYPISARTPSVGQQPLASLICDSEAAAAAEELLEQLVPTEDIMRIMRKCLPAHAKVSGKAKQAIQESVLNFISAVTSVAAEHCRQQQRQMVTSEDMLVALKGLSLNGCAEPLRVYLSKLRQMDPLAMGKEEDNLEETDEQDSGSRLNLP